MEAKKRNIWLDLFKILLAFFVVCIHTVRNKYGLMCLYRIAVPIFFMISGYFLYNTDKEIRLKKAKGFIKRSIIYLVISEVIYILFGFFRCVFTNQNFVAFFHGLIYEDFLFSFFFLNMPISGYEHLWFLVALVVISIIHYLLVRFEKTKIYWLLTPFLLFTKMFFIGWASVIKPEYGSVYYMYVRNALFFGLPCFGLGFTMASFNFNKKSWHKYIYLVLGIAFWLLQLLECQLVVMEVYITTVISSFFLLQFFLGLKPVKCDWYYNWVGKNISFYIYILHSAVGILLKGTSVFAKTHLYSLLVFAICIVIYELSFLTIKLVKHLIKKHKEKQITQESTKTEEPVESK